MKKATFLLLLMFTMSSFSKMMAQEITCDQFCVTNIRMDTNPDILIVNIFFSSDEDNHINYPHVSLVTNEEGDTLATGTLNFFVQFPNTEQEYYLDYRIDSIPSDLIVNIEFKYDTNTCLLNYPCLNDPTNEWFPVGAEWYYNQVSFSPPSESYVHLIVTDSIEINGVSARVISGGCMCSQDHRRLYCRPE